MKIEKKKKKEREIAEKIEELLKMAEEMMR